MVNYLSWSHEKTRRRKPFLFMSGTSLPQKLNLFTKVQLMGQKEAPLVYGQYYLSEEDTFMMRTDLHSGLHPIVKSQGGLMTSAVLNTTPEDIRLKPGIRYGIARPTCNWSDRREYPNFICTLKKNESQAAKMAAKAKEAAQNKKGVQPLPMGKMAK